LSHPGPLECIDDRCLSNNFPIDTGRIFNIDKSERYCNLCNVSELGEEFHYLFKCTFFNNVRAKFLPRNICNNPNVFKNGWIHQIYLHLYILASLGRYTDEDWEIHRSPNNLCLKRRTSPIKIPFHQLYVIGRTFRLEI
jgi:hypothetical protein